MRLVVLGLSLALAGSAPLGLAVAQSPVTTQPLAAGEVLLEVNAMGSVTSRADYATVSVSIGGEGDDEAAARAATETKLRELRAALRTLGVADADIRIRPVTTSTNPPPPISADLAVAEMNAMAMTDDSNMAMAMEAPPRAAAYGQAAGEIVIRNIDRVTAVQRALMERGLSSPGLGPTYALVDAGTARRGARAEAMQMARADAEAYAASLNMRVVRIVRITERIGFDGLGLLISEAQPLARLFAGQIMGGPEVLTMIAVGVDFALAPR